MKNLNKYLLAGIDYSINSPAMSMYIGDMEKDRFFLGNLDFFAYADTKKVENENRFVKINDGSWQNFMERWRDIALKFLYKIFEIGNKNNVLRDNIYIIIEGYSYHAPRSLKPGLVFNIAEATAILKYILYINKLKFKIYQPKSVKKFITGNGNANKKLVYDTICKDLKINLSEYLKIKEGDLLYDFSDSFSILYMLYNEMMLHNKLNYLVLEEQYNYLTKKNEQGYSILEENFI